MAHVTRETELYAPVRDYLVANGYTVQAEVGDCDIVAQRGDDLILIELKRAFTVDLLVQATARQKVSHSVYVALPAEVADVARKRWRGLCRVLRQLELGLILVRTSGSTAGVSIEFHPVPYQRQQRKAARRAVLSELAGRSGDYNTGGSRGVKRITAYRENALFIACVLEQSDASSPKLLRASGTGPKTRAILANNVYGWFERIDRGVYALTSQGRHALEEYPQVAAYYRNQIAAAKTADHHENDGGIDPA